MPVAGNTQPFGHLHGGASCVLVETLGSLAAMSEVGPGGQVFGVDINVTHHRSATAGWVTGEASALYLGGRTATYEVAITDDAGIRHLSQGDDGWRHDGPPACHLGDVARDIGRDDCQGVLASGKRSGKSRA